MGNIFASCGNPPEPVKLEFGAGRDKRSLQYDDLDDVTVDEIETRLGIKVDHLEERGAATSSVRPLFADERGSFRKVIQRGKTYHVVEKRIDKVLTDGLKSFGNSIGKAFKEVSDSASKAASSATSKAATGIAVATFLR
eukprot:TRINITY_DN5756_c0_g1_i1.p2 TRINITY_DN5756_c0_g1~~TRINITY_DN5756_c0_g1_i1.p2  ORF type:complete len:139 (-),score=71.04 TRINITY_DN5756_c0_g1_i1:261-677(-)